MNNLNAKYASRGLVILGFPCNQFGGQEPGNAQTIRQFTDSKGVEFQIMEKIEVNGPRTHPVYRYLKSQSSDQDVSWNFGAAFVVAPDGSVVRYDGKMGGMGAAIDEGFLSDLIESKLSSLQPAI